MPDYTIPTATELREMPLPQLLTLLAKVEQSDRELSNQDEPPDSPARRANALVRRRLLRLCGVGSHLDTNPDYYVNEEDLRYEEERLRARERGEEGDWQREQFFRRNPSFEPWPPDDISAAEIEEEFVEKDKLIARLIGPPPHGIQGPNP